jgi:formate dehydrogenase
VKEGDARPPAITVRVCETLSCRMAGAESLMASLQRLGMRDVRVIGAPCVGRCESAPVAGRRAQPDPARDGRRGARPPVSAKQRRGRATRRRSTTRPTGATAATDARRVCDGQAHPRVAIAELESSGIRGLGGAGFPAGRKWKIVRAEPAPRLMAINIDEGEPGTFKDRWYLERDPHVSSRGC